MNSASIAPYIAPQKQRQNYVKLSISEDMAHTYQQQAVTIAQMPTLPGQGYPVIWAFVPPETW
jgi:hypothetical protein